ncbi:aldose epimerase family protein [Paraburkholderia sp. MM5482-R1]|uniref:aldose epimerase family protein n=1 Tax=unclassified Paraburkholderia TaxID=2615204 RepID=UPI003D23CBBD
MLKLRACAALILLAGLPALATASAPYVDVKPAGYQSVIDGKQTDLYTLKNKQGMVVKISNYGGKIVELLVPDRNGNLGDVVMGFDTIEDGNRYNPSTGAIIGRYANRIAKGQFTMDGKLYQLSINNGPNHLHGGKKGSRFRVFDAKQLDDHTLQINYVFKDGEEGYPGNCSLKVVYTLTDDNALKIRYDSVTDRKTIVNFSNHAGFNLSGDPSNSIVNHVVTIDADTFTPVVKLIPTGERRSVKGTPFDFTKPTRIADLIYTQDDQLKQGQQLANPPAEGGYDHNWFLNKRPGELGLAARVYEPTSGRVLEIYTTEPAIHFYSGNALPGTDVGKGGRIYGFRSFFTMLAEHPDDSPNEPNWPTTVLNPGERFTATTIYKFSTAKSAGTP